MDTQNIGYEGEQIAIRYLRRRGYKILETNYRTPQAEIDIIAQHQEAVVFIEVKSSWQGHDMARKVTMAKRKSIRQGAEHFLHFHKMQKKSVRFEVVTVAVKTQQLQHFPAEFFDF